MKKIKHLINSVLRKFGYQVARAKVLYFDPVIDSDADFIRIYEQIKDYTMTSKVQCFSLYMTVKYIIEAEIEGDFVECGVWRGGNCMLIAKTLILMNNTDRKIYLYDTFEGMAEPKEIDFSIENKNDKARSTWIKEQNNDYNNWCYASLEEVRNNMIKVDYPENKLIYVKGKVEDTIPKITPDKISVLRLDTDWYDSTKHELDFLYPKLSYGGVLMIDDYGTWSGSKKAVDEFFEKKPVLLTRIDSGNRLVVKTQNNFKR